MDVEAEIREDMKKLGCTSELQITLAYHLYIYLVDDKLMYDTEYCFNSDINVLYVVARPRKDEKLNIYVPKPSQHDFSMVNINILQENLCTIETGPTVNLAFIDSDLTIVIYTFTKDLVGRQSPNSLEVLRKSQEKRRFINTELKKQRKKILNDAFNGGSIDDDDMQVVNLEAD